MNPAVEEDRNRTETVFRIRPFQIEDEEAVVWLWLECGLVVPQNDPRKDIEAKLQIQPELFLVGALGGRIVASVMAGYEGHRGWINYLAVAPEHRRREYGRRIMARAEEVLRALDCPKINLQVRTRNTEAIRFYKRLGYMEDAVVSLGKRL